MDTARPCCDRNSCSRTPSLVDRTRTCLSLFPRWMLDGRNSSRRPRVWLSRGRYQDNAQAGQADQALDLTLLGDLALCLVDVTRFERRQVDVTRNACLRANDLGAPIRGSRDPKEVRAAAERTSRHVSPHATERQKRTMGEITTSFNIPSIVD